MTRRIVLLTGSDAPDRADVLRRAAEMAAERIGSLEAASDAFASEPWGFAAEGEFLNQALALRTALDPECALDEVQRMERDLGRKREEEEAEKARTGQRYASRRIDIDIMFYDDREIDSPRLTVPHPLLHLREFALRPLCAIMGDYVHPRLGRTLREIYDRLRAADGNEQKSKERI